MSKRMAVVDQADRFNFTRLYAAEKYSLQNMELVRTSGFPAKFEQGKIMSVYEDRLPISAWHEAVAMIDSSQSGDALFADATHDSLLRFGAHIAEVCNFNHPVTAVRVVRYTNVSSGYPCLLVVIGSGGEGSLGYSDEPKARQSRYDDWNMEAWGNERSVHQLSNRKWEKELGL